MHIYIYILSLQQFSGLFEIAIQIKFLQNSYTFFFILDISILDTFISCHSYSQWKLYISHLTSNISHWRSMYLSIFIVNLSQNGRYPMRDNPLIYASQDLSFTQLFICFACRSWAKSGQRCLSGQAGLSYRYMYLYSTYILVTYKYWYFSLMIAYCFPFTAHFLALLSCVFIKFIAIYALYTDVPFPNIFRYIQKILIYKYIHLQFW